MAFLKWCFLLSFLAVVLSDGSLVFPDVEVNLNHDKIMQYIQSRQDLLDILKEYPHAEKKKQSAIVNEFADQLIQGLNEMLTQVGVDPVELPGFEKNFFVLLVRGWIKLSEGELRGIATIERKGDIIVEYQYPKLNLHLVLGLGKLTFEYLYEAKLLGIGPKGIMEGKSSGSKFTIDLAIDLTNLRASMDTWRLNSIGRLSVKFRGSLTGQIINILSTVVIPLLQPIIKAALDIVIGDRLGVAVDEYNKIICQVLGDCPEFLY